MNSASQDLRSFAEKTRCKRIVNSYGKTVRCEKNEGHKGKHRYHGHAFQAIQIHNARIGNR